MLVTFASFSRCERADENAGVVHYMNVNRPDIKDNVVYRNINNASRLRRLLVDLWRNCLLPFRDEFRYAITHDRTVNTR